MSTTTPDGPFVESGQPAVPTWLLLLTVGLGTLTGPWNFTMLVVALPDIADDFSISLATTSWVIIVPMIASSSVQSVGGRLGDILGYRRVFAGSLIGYTIITIAAAFAPSLWVLVALRALQTTFGSVTFPTGNALIRVNLPESQRASAYGVIGAAISFAIAGGPFIGGALTGIFGWQAIFIANLPFSIGALILLLLYIPNDTRPETSVRWQSRFDPVGILLLAASVISIVLPMALLRDGLFPPIGLPFVYAAAIAIVYIFVRWEWRQPDPIVQVRLYLSRSFRAAAFGDMFMNSAGFPLTVVASIYLQAYLDQSVVISGIVIALGTVGGAVASPVGGRLADRFGRRFPMILGRSIMVVGLVLTLAIVGLSSNPWLFTLGMGLVFSGNGLALPAGQTAAIEASPRDFSGMAAGVAATTAFMGGIVGITWTAIYLGEEPVLDQFQVVFTVFAIGALIAIFVATRVAPWPASERDD
ncbi:MAG: MFS transporter [Thermomicrobiales bacterium]